MNSAHWPSILPILVAMPIWVAVLLFAIWAMIRRMVLPALRENAQLLSDIKLKSTVAAEQATMTAKEVDKVRGKQEAIKDEIKSEVPIATAEEVVKKIDGDSGLRPKVTPPAPIPSPG